MILITEGQLPTEVPLALPVTADFEDVSLPSTPARPIARVYDFFSGCGGTSAGLQRAGMTPVMAVDFDREAAATYKANFPGAQVFCEDIRRISSADIEQLFERERTLPVIFSACAPCQPFSRQNRQKQAADGRITLLSELQRFIDRFRPEVLFIENVPGLKDAGEEAQMRPFASLLRQLDDLGYQYDCRILRAMDYGVPQSRRRLILIASNFGPISLPPPTHGPGLEPYVTVRQAIGSYPALAAGEADQTFANHRAAQLSPLNLDRIRASKQGEGRANWHEDLRLRCHGDQKIFTDVYARMWWDRPAPALTTRCISISNGRFGHPDQDRAISVREAAALQTFDDEFVFKGSLNGMARQIGNAVPVRLAEIVGRTIAQHLNAHMKGF